MSDEQWDRTAWWLQRTYLEGLHREGILGSSQDGPPTTETETESGPEPEPEPGSSEPDISLASFDELRSMGLTVIEGGRTDG